MNILGSTALVTGANGGLGQAFVNELLRRGAKKIYVAARNSANLDGLFGRGEAQIVPIALDVTVADQVASAAVMAADVDLLINNAGLAAFTGALSAEDLAGAREEMAVNYFGTLAMTRAFAPALAKSGGGAIVNMLSMVSLVSIPAAATYSASKAAALSLTRSVRAELAQQGTLVVGVLAVQADTAMGANLPEPRLTPDELVADALDAVDAGRNEEIAAGQLTRNAYAAFTADPAAFQARMSKLLPASAPV